MCELPLTGCMAISQIPEARTYRASAFLTANLGVERLLSLTINDRFGSIAASGMKAPDSRIEDLGAQPQTPHSP